VNSVDASVAREDAESSPRHPDEHAILLPLVSFPPYGIKEGSSSYSSPFFSRFYWLPPLGELERAFVFSLVIPSVSSLHRPSLLANLKVLSSGLFFF